MDPAKAFEETARSYGLAVAVLLGLVVGLLWIFWRLGTRLVNAHEKYLETTAGEQKELKIEMKGQTTVLAEIKTVLPTICHAECSLQPNGPLKTKRNLT